MKLRLPFAAAFLLPATCAFEASRLTLGRPPLTPGLRASTTNGDSAEAAAADFAVTPSADASSGNAARRPVITFVTGNLLKLKEAQHILDATCSVPFELVAYGKLDLDELQSDIPEKIAAAKCRLAAMAVGGPVMIDDTSLCFNALGGLPGPYIKWFMDSVGCSGLVKMLHGFSGDPHGRTAWAQCCIAFSPGPGAEPSVFSGRTEGFIVDTYTEGDSDAEKQGFGWDAIFVPLDQQPTRISQGGRTWLDHGARRTFAEMSLAEKSAISHRGRALRQFSVFLQDNEDWVTGRAEKRGAAPKAPVDDLFSFRRRRRMM